jgi:hypothetical protein
MSKDNELEDDEVGYGKPPKSGQFQKGVSGNPSGRPKKRLDLISGLMRVLRSKVTIQEKGKQKVITRLEAIWKQAVHRALSGDPKAIDLVVKWGLQGQEWAAEALQNSPNKPDYENRKAVDFTDDELALIIQGIHPKYPADQEPRKRSGLRKKS